MTPPAYYGPSSARLANILFIIRVANRRSQHVADGIRTSLRPTHHARRRAQRLGLSIDMDRARACPQSQISRQDLPILDTHVSPVVSTSESAAVRPVIPPIVIPPVGSRRRAQVPLSPIASALSDVFSLPDVEMESPRGIPRMPATPRLSARELPAEEEDSWMDNVVFSPLVLDPTVESDVSASESSDSSSSSDYSTSSSSASSDARSPCNSGIVLRIKLPAKRKLDEDSNDSCQLPKVRFVPPNSRLIAQFNDSSK
ncbi:hypothetical protein PLICRDRAFT_429435 [Plicaturopsis crispa FD-325 SS-3]|nr:hypothetical protein PLICRDRAFT_429435 [Plicaturopsis crispa FD-325 SS-3]